MALHPLFQAGGGAMGLQVGSVDHQDSAVSVLRFGQFLENALEHAILRPSPETVVERLARTVFGGGIRPLPRVLNPNYCG